MHSLVVLCCVISVIRKSTLTLGMLGDLLVCMRKLLDIFVDKCVVCRGNVYFEATGTDGSLTLLKF